jgi:hypothetical protein
VKVAVLGAGPAGLYFAISMKRRNPAHEITVFERNRPDDTFGWGVVLSAETLDNLAANDAVSAAWITEYFAYWDDIAVVHKGVRTVSTGHGFCGIGRKRLLQLLQRRAGDLGIELVFESEIADPRPFMASHDLVIGDFFRAKHFGEQEFNGLIDPVVMLDHFHMTGPTFDPHPHAGISAVTYVFEDATGAHVNYDSLGNRGPINPGALHWFAAGRGAVHTEQPEGDGRHVHALQIFVNMPASKKLNAPNAVHVRIRHVRNVVVEYM